MLSKLRLRLYQAMRLTWNAAGDLRFGEILRGDVPTRFRELGAERTANVSYLALSLIFENVAIASDDVLVDVGCGKGRVINWWLSKRLSNRIVGLELDPEVAAHTRERLRRYHNVTIVAGDGIDNLPADGTLFFLFNPFAESVVIRFKEQILQSARRDKVRIYYYNCVHVSVFENDARFSVEHRNLISNDWPAPRREVMDRLLDTLAVIRLKDA